MRRHNSFWHTFSLFAALLTTSAEAQRTSAPADYVIAVTFDGARWQEVFGGARRELIDRATGGVRDTAATLERFYPTDAAARRRALMPFFWGEIARRGLVLGDSTEGSEVRITNRKWFSYPGYNELLAGHPDDRIDSNGKIPNPNRTVLEWLNGRPGWRGRVAAFGSWDVLPFIVNTERSGLYANGDGPPVTTPATPLERALNDLAADLPPYWGTVRFDAVTMQGALHYLRTRRPRVLYVMLGDTDEWAHERRYDLYLDGLYRADRFLRTLWETAQSMPGYRGRTALLVSTDHGRGSAADWTDHGREVPAAERVWVGLMTPRQARATGAGSGRFTQGQFAATIAALLGLEREFRRDNPKAAAALPIP